MTGRIPPHEEAEIQEAVAAAVMRTPRGLAHGLDTDPDVSLLLVESARIASAESGRLLRESITSARAAGLSWDAIGGVLGVSRQAAQQRFGGGPMPTDAGDRRVLSPVTAFDEMAALENAGRHGWHSVDYGTLHHVLEKSDEQWEHRRALWGTVRRAEFEADGWRLIRANTFPWSYWARPTGTPALPDDESPAGAPRPGAPQSAA